MREALVRALGYGKTSPYEQYASCLLEAVRRGAIYAEAGADGLFVPLLTDLALIEQLVERVSLPVNIMAMPTVNGMAIDPAISPAAISRPAYCAWKAADPGMATGSVRTG